MIEPGRGDRLPSASIVHPGHHVSPPQGPGLLGANASQQAQRHVSVHARALGDGQQCLRLLQREALRRPSNPAPRWLNECGDVARDEIVRMRGAQFDPLAVEAFLAEEATLRQMVALKCTTQQPKGDLP